ncbi:MAG TPA: DUF881 domain-containing protein [Marmoricola sp.]|nr:DUF881 domain-containing protein [Marmoricola sp.]
MADQRGHEHPTAPLDADGRPLPPQARMGLLDYVTAHSLDEDYAQAAGKRAGAGGEQPRGTRRRVPTLVALAVFGGLVATAGVQTARTEPVRQSSRESLVAQVEDRREELAETRQQIDVLEGAVEEARGQLRETTRVGRALNEQLETLGLLSGTEPATGPGLRIVVDDSDDAADTRQVVLDTDLQRLVNGLWVSGAEAVAINGQRLTSLSSIRVAGDAITVNLQSLTRPYVIEALGDPDQLAARFIDSEGGTWWLNLKAVYDLQFSMSSEESLTLPAAPTPTLRHAHRPGADS